MSGVAANRGENAGSGIRPGSLVFPTRDSSTTLFPRCDLSAGLVSGDSLAFSSSRDGFCFFHLTSHHHIEAHRQTVISGVARRDTSGDNLGTTSGRRRLIPGLPICRRSAGV